MKNKIFFGIILIILLSLVQIGASQPVESALEIKVVEVKGDVAVQRNKGLAKINNGMKLAEGEIIITGSASSVLLELEDGATILIGSLSILKLDVLKGVDEPGQSKKRRYRIRLKLKIGKVRTKVPAVRGLKKRFRVQTPKGTASVRGTEKEVSYSHDEGMRVRVIKGFVDVQTRFNLGKRIGKGEVTIVNDIDTDPLREEKITKIDDMQAFYDYHTSNVGLCDCK